MYKIQWRYYPVPYDPEWTDLKHDVNGKNIERLTKEEAEAYMKFFSTYENKEFLHPH